ncbi:MAG: ROK family transcriptional regulator [Ramlibacter sp.]
MDPTGDQQLVKRINRSLLLRLMRARPGLSRAQLAAGSGLTKSTVGVLVRELMEQGWLSEAPAASSAEPGRPSTPLHINGRSRGLIGVEIAVEFLRVAGVSVLGEVVWSAEEPLTSTVPAATCAQAARLARRGQVALAALGMELSGLGVGLPGAFDGTTGRVLFAPNLGWRDLDFLPLIGHALAKAGVAPVPLHVQNEADTAALSEYEFASGGDEGALIFLTCDVGVGAGIVLNDRLFTGVHGMAGEIGHSILQVDGPVCSCGRRGCAEAFIGARAIARHTRELGHIRPAGRSLGVLLQNLWTTFNPGVLVVGGPSCIRHPELVQTARETLQAYARDARMTPPEVRTARYGLLAAAVGAAALVLHDYLRPMLPRARRSRSTPALPAA